MTACRRKGRSTARRDTLSPTRSMAPRKPKRSAKSTTPKPGAAGPRSAGRLQRAIDETVRREIEAALAESGGNMAEAARSLGITYPSFWERLKRLGIDPSRFRP